MTTISIDQQAIAVELAARGTQGFIDNRGSRIGAEETARRQRCVIELEAAARTLYWLRDNEAAIKAALGKGASYDD